jgi:hypothetical protein
MPPQSLMPIDNSGMMGYQDPSILSQGVSNQYPQDSSNDSIAENQPAFAQSEDVQPAPYSAYQLQNSDMPEGLQEAPENMVQQRRTGTSRTDAIDLENEDEVGPQGNQRVKQSMPSAGEQNQLRPSLSEEEEPEQSSLFRPHLYQDFPEQSVEMDESATFD